MSNKIVDIIVTVLCVIGSIFSVGVVFGIMSLNPKCEVVEQVNLESIYETTTGVTTSEKITTTATSTTLVTTTSTEKSLTSPTTTVTTVLSEITLCETQEPENDFVEPVNDYTEIYETEEVVSTYSEITDEEYRMLVLTVYLEAGNQSLECKKGIASVVMNRVNHEDFPDSVYSVLTQQGQFTIDFSRTDTPDNECYEAVDYVLTYGSIMPIDVKYFFADYCTDAWLWSRQIYSQIGEVIFSY